MMVPKNALHKDTYWHLRIMKKLRTIDLFCGAGGSSWGARLAGASIIAGFDISDSALAAYEENFPEAKLFGGSIEDINPNTVKRRLGRVDLILASPECQSHSLAKGNAKRSNRSRRTAFEVVRFAKVLKPRWIIIENVVGMRRWSEYGRFIRALKREGYNVREEILNAADFGVPQRRRRLFLLCDKMAEPQILARKPNQHVPVSAVLKMNGEYSFSQLRTKVRAHSTLIRANRAIREVGTQKPFLLVYYGSDKAGGWQTVSEPLRTITTLDRFALVRRKQGLHVMRMLQVPELKKAMGMPLRFSVGNKTRRTQIQLVGNAVCPPVMRAIVTNLTAD
jgi:DNA (cytosine-5)-methyltransferase 1